MSPRQLIGVGTKLKGLRVHPLFGSSAGMNPSFFRLFSLHAATKVTAESPLRAYLGGNPWNCAPGHVGKLCIGPLAESDILYRIRM